MEPYFLLSDNNERFDLTLSPLMPPTLRCVLCRIRGGARKRSECGQWAHVVCVVWTPELGVREGTMAPKRLELDPARARLRCALCGGRGAAIECAFGDCAACAHPFCALGDSKWVLSSARDFALYCPTHQAEAPDSDDDDVSSGNSSSRSQRSSNSRSSSSSGGESDSDETAALIAHESVKVDRDCSDSGRRWSGAHTPRHPLRLSHVDSISGLEDTPTEVTGGFKPDGTSGGNYGGGNYGDEFGALVDTPASGDRCFARSLLLADTPAASGGGGRRGVAAADSSSHSFGANLLVDTPAAPLLQARRLPTTPWSCRKCTFHNAAEATVCGMCEAGRARGRSRLKKTAKVLMMQDREQRKSKKTKKQKDDNDGAGAKLAKCSKRPRQERAAVSEKLARGRAVAKSLVALEADLSGSASEDEECTDSDDASHNSFLDDQTQRDNDCHM